MSDDGDHPEKSGSSSTVGKVLSAAGDFLGVFGGWLGPALKLLAIAVDAAIDYFSEAVVVKDMGKKTHEFSSYESLVDALCLTVYKFGAGALSEEDTKDRIHNVLDEMIREPSDGGYGISSKKLLSVLKERRETDPRPYEFFFHWFEGKAGWATIFKRRKSISRDSAELIKDPNQIMETISKNVFGLPPPPPPKMPSKMASFMRSSFMSSADTEYSNVIKETTIEENDQLKEIDEFNELDPDGVEDLIKMPFVKSAEID